MKSLKNIHIYLIRTLAIVIIVATLIPLLTSEYWIVRIFDFPRVQIVILTLIIFIVFLIFDYRHRKRGKILLIILVAIIIYQLINIWPYTFLAKKDALAATSQPEAGAELKILVSNVLMKNTAYNQFIDMVNKNDPDLLLTLETDKNWGEALAVIHNSYPYQVQIPKDNTYGMHLYSKFPLSDSQVKYWLDQDIPSIRTLFRLPSGQMIDFFAVHPKPPVPGEDEDSRKRDGEIMIVANRVADAENPVIVAGDFNDVAWSATTRLFLKVSGLLDPRIGRGFYNTYHAEIPFLRWPLDHVFYSAHFRLVQLSRLPSIGSDHFPIMIHLSFDPDLMKEQDIKPADSSTKAAETQTIEEGIEDAKKE
ncbi:MAG: endonuclease/exonuclease/phosphatase family protein [Candidatus Cyclobacteriaceae bacterium M3_2C_046]